MRIRLTPLLAAAALTALTAASVQAGPLIFEKGEYAARRARLMERIGNGAAIVLGAQPLGGYREYVQNNDFIYLTGVEIPDAVLVIDGTRKASTLFFTTTERAVRNEGIDAALVTDPKGTTGIEEVAPFADLYRAIAAVRAEGRPIFTMLSPEELARECSREKLNSLTRTMTRNEWDGRPTREQQFVRVLRDRYPGIEVRDLSPLVWELRAIKSPAEIAVLRKAGRIAVQATIELMKATEPEMYEYELAALYEYMVKREGAQDLAYYMIMSSAENHPYVHYYRHDRLLKDGDFLVVDVGPDLHYYDIDISVSYPVNGRFTPRQREVYEAANAVHEANMKVYRPGLTLEQCRKEVEEILRTQGFDLTKDHFQKMRGGFGHFVGLAVHDVGGSPQVLAPGMVIANEPMVVYADEHLGVRVEDTILITETGCENLTPGLPRTVREIEAIMKEKGLSQRTPRTIGRR